MNVPPAPALQYNRLLGSETLQVLAFEPTIRISAQRRTAHPENRLGNRAEPKQNPDPRRLQRGVAAARLSAQRLGVLVCKMQLPHQVTGRGCDKVWKSSTWHTAGVQ